jgi:glycosyltransferase involved in cell wall biosynthesis
VPAPTAASESRETALEPEALRVAIAHEWLVRYAGSERCVLEMLEEFPDAQLLTTIVSSDDVPAPLRRAEPSLLQHLPRIARRRHEWLLPAMPAAWRLRPAVSGVDIVISSSHACAKAVRVEDGIPHLCYCHTPMRYAWDFSAEAARFPRPLRRPAQLGVAFFRRWDRRRARDVTRFVANSRAVRDRIRRYYGREADVIHPPVDTDFFTPEGPRGEEFLYVGRLVSYKRPDVAVDAFAGLPYRLVVVGRGDLERRLRERATPNVTFVEEVESTELRRLYRSARAVIVPAEEDFGISTAEAQACGTPALALAAGGSLDIVEDGVTGWLVEDQSAHAFRGMIERAAREELDPGGIRVRAERFSRERFRSELRAVVRDLVSAEKRTG